MLEFLQTGKALYVLAAVCGLGVVTRWLTRNLYKRLIKETDNMSLTKNKNLRAFKQKTESSYQMNQGIPKIRPYLERQMYDFRFMGMTLNGWNTFSNQMTLLCFLAGGAAAFGAYWYRTDPYYIVLYGSMGILAGLFTILVDHGAGVADKKQQLFTALDNYLENTLIYRLDQERDETQAISGPHMETRENIRSIYPAAAGTAAGQAEEPEKQESVRGKQRNRTERMKNQLKAESQARRQNSGRSDGRQRDGRQGGIIQENIMAETGMGMASDEASGIAGNQNMAQEMARSGSGPSEMEGSIRDVDYLKKSLEQIAASRERGRTVKQQEDWLKDLNPDELKLIGEILHEYLT